MPKTATLPIIGAEAVSGGKWRATCVACPEWRGARRLVAGDAYLEGREHQATEHTTNRSGR